MILGLAICAVTATAAWTIAGGNKTAYVGLFALHALVFLAAVAIVLRRRLGGRGLILIIAIGLAVRLVAMLVPATLTTDAYRYIWDGRVQAAGINPYLYVPADPRLAQLRDDVIYPNINRKESYPTIYPPAAEMILLASRVFGDGLYAISLTMLLFEGIIVWAIVAWLSGEGIARERVLIYAWHPLPIWEFTSQGHLDAAMTAFLMLAVLAATRGRQALAGAALAVAALVKYPVLLFGPALWRRWRLGMPLAMLAAVAMLYAPYVPDAGLKVIGSLFLHLDEEGYGDGYGFYLVGMPRHMNWPYVPSTTFAVAAAFVLIALGVRIMLRRDQDRIDARELILLVSAFFVLVSPHYPWYYAVAVPLLCRSLSLGLLFMTLIASGVYLEAPDGPLEPYTRIKIFTVMYVGAAVLWFAEWALMRTGRLPEFLTPPVRPSRP